MKEQSAAPSFPPPIAGMLNCGADFALSPSEHTSQVGMGELLLLDRYFLVVFSKLTSSSVDIGDMRLHVYDYAVNLSQQTKILAGSKAGFLPLGVVMGLAANTMAVYAYAHYKHS